MSDLIDRQAAIDALCDNCNHVQAVCPHYPCKQYTSIERLPSATQTNDSNTLNALGWIPVTERLQEEQQIVATYQKWGEYKLNHIIDGTEWYWDGVVAWMPIEPYREEADNAQLD